MFYFVFELYSNKVLNKVSMGYTEWKVPKKKKIKGTDIRASTNITNI